MKRTEVSWEVHTLYVFRSQQDKKNSRSPTLVLLYQVKLNIARQNGYANQNIILLHFLANKPRRELSGIRKKKKNPGCYPRECRTEPSKTKHSKKSSHSFKVRPLVGKIQTKLLRRDVDSVVGCSLKLFQSLSRDCFATLPELNMKAEISELQPGIILFVMNIAIATGF